MRNYHQRPAVREKRRWEHFERRYGLTREAYLSLLEGQNGACATCGSVVDLCVDHNHETGAVRGILCGKCNMALGLAGDDPDTLKGMLAYLENS